MVETEPVLLEKLSEHGQLDLLYDMEQPLAFVLAKMEIAGVKVKKETLLEMQAENEVVIEQLTQEIYEPVSYTHLDVYKRQVLKSISGGCILASVPLLRPFV